MLKVGDKVKIREDLEVGQRYGGAFFASGYMESLKGKEAIITDIFTGGYNIDIDIEDWSWTEEMLEKIEAKNIKELTFRKVITNIKEGETWESENYIIKCSHKVISIETKNGEIFNGIAFCDAILFTLQRKQYSFEEAFKSLKDGKEIESVVSGRGFKTRNSVSKYVLNNREIVDKVNDEFRLFSYNEIRNKWYIND
ncbi:hypothetical protein H8J86_08400 [Clostridium perfringens]|uniref:hypothetical protein n=1 Tax=Clostridium perfringens TaxID=1502 RepID=UPI0018E482F1|nr:hypothetical protein [Clostridium perfringens]MBI6005974.1 hypothetical protein [Clostridium perfringens]MDK0621669.1 hypothetical protein [Clostridium perfringens]